MTASPEGRGRQGGRSRDGVSKEERHEEVLADQRRRMIDAMVGLVAEQGYAATTVAHVIERAGVSRKTFYEHFPERKNLLLAAFDDASPVALEQARAASERTGGSTRQLESMMRRLCRSARESPGSVALCTTEVAAANPSGILRHDELMEEYGELIDVCLRDDGQPALTDTLARALAGGTHRTIDAHLRTGRAHQLPDLAPQLARWARSHHPVPPTLAESAQPAEPWPWMSSSDGLLGGRAPGTLTLAPDGYQPHVGKRSSGFVQHANRERILDAVAQLISEHGYTDLTASAIAERADLPERAFLAHFKSKDEAFAATLELGHVKGQAIVQRARSGISAWRTGVRAGVHALVEFLASEPYFTRLAFVDAPLAGPAMAHRTQEHLSAYARLLFDGAPQRRRPPLIAPEAAMHAIVELGFHHAARHTVGELRSISNEIAYLALAPFVGVTEAAEAVVSA
ncbi:MAG: TetR/AcrR family transcriptional regulator [Solirubrobacteraceae bacterium]